jgi:hypothetical protein
MTRALPPSPEYFRRFVRNWCGGLDAEGFVILDGSARCPHVVGKAIYVGADWLQRQAIPRKVLET